MDKSLVFHACLAIASASVAYTAWVKPTITEKDDAVIMVSGTAEHLTEVRWQDEEHQVQVHKEGKKARVLVSKTNPPTPQEEYPGTQVAEQLFERLAPLKAARDLGLIDANHLKPYGLDAPKSRLTLVFGGTQQEVQVGSTTFGSGDYYTLAPDQHVYLLRSSYVGALGHGGVGLQDRDVVGIPKKDIERLHIATQDKSRDLVQRHQDDPAQAYFADPADPTRKLELSGTWIDRLLGLRVIGLVEAPPAGEPALSVSVFAGRDEIGQVRLWPGDDKGAIAVTPRYKKAVLIYKPSAEAVLKDAAAAVQEGR